VEETFGNALRWLEHNGDRRFFLFVHTYQVHYPYTPPERYAHLFAEPAPGWEPDPLLSPDRAPALYDREIRYLDDQLRSFFEALGALGLARDTLVVVTSDHGEEFMEHGAVGHGPHLNAEVTRVPLLFAGPGIARGRRLMQPLGHVDLMPTLLELAGIPLPGAAMGRSFAGQLRAGAPAAAEDAVALYAEAWRFRPVDRLGPPLAIRVGHRKLIRTPTEAGAAYEYYELAGDPREQRNLYGTAGAATGDLEEWLERHVAEVAKRRGERNPDVGVPDEPVVDPDREAKLRALGYIQ
jgi:arylsulfatase A-like enzyme